MENIDAPTVTVVMPVYNTEAYVGNAIESILSQTFEDFEFLIVDNGSTDNSGKIIDGFAERDRRIRVLRNEKNVYISEARNRAIQIAKGKYLCLIDSDDWALSNMLEVMCSRAEETKAQYVVAGYFMDYCIHDKHYCYSVCPDDRFYEQTEFRKNAIQYLTRTLLTVPWNKLYSISYLREHQIKFRNTKLEDHHFNMDILMDVERVCMISEPFYHYYRSRPGTDTELVYNQFLNQKKRDHLKHTLAVYEHWGIQDEETMQQLANYHLGRLVQCIVQTTCNSQIDKETRDKEIHRILKDELTTFAIKRCGRCSMKIALLSLPIRMRSRSMCLLMGWSIDWFRRHFSAEYYRIRAALAQRASVS